MPGFMKYQYTSIRRESKVRVASMGQAYMHRSDVNQTTTRNIARFALLNISIARQSKSKTRGDADGRSFKCNIGKQVKFRFPVERQI